MHDFVWLILGTIIRTIESKALRAREGYLMKWLILTQCTAKNGQVRVSSCKWSCFISC